MDAAEFISGLQNLIAAYPLATIAIATAGGALSTTTCPCTLPVGIGLVGYVGSQIDLSPERTRRTGSIALAFFVGLVLSLTTIGILASIAGRVLAEWDAVFAAGSAIFALAAGAIAIFGPTVRRKFPNPHVRRRGGISGAFVYGLLYSIATVTSSAAPLMLILTLAAAVGRPGFGAAIAVAFAVGRGLPFLLVGLFAGRALTFAGRLERYHRPAELVSGVALVSISAYFGILAAALA